MPVGVRRSPSRFAGEVPRPPSHAVHGRAAARQQPPLLRQSRSVACVDARVGGIAVTSCVAEPVESWFASVGAQARGESSPAEAEAASASASSGRATHLIDLQTTDLGRAPARRVRPSGTAVRALDLAGDGGATATLVAPGLPGRTGGATAPTGLALGLRRPRPYGDACGERACRDAPRAGVLAALRRPLPAPMD